MSEQPVAVDVRDRDPVAVVVVRRLVGLPGVVDDAMSEGDAAFGDAVGELEVVEHRQRRPAALICASPTVLSQDVSCKVGGTSLLVAPAVPVCADTTAWCSQAVSRTAERIRLAAMGSGTGRVPRARRHVLKWSSEPVP